MSINIELNTLGFESVTASKEIRSFSEDKKNKILEEIILSLENLSSMGVLIIDVLFSFAKKLILGKAKA